MIVFVTGASERTRPMTPAEESALLEKYRPLVRAVARVVRIEILRKRGGGGALSSGMLSATL